MSDIAVGHLVEHRNDPALGQGRVLYVQRIAGITQVGVQWTSSTQPLQHTLAELLPLRPLPDRLADVGVASRQPFQLKVLGRWFEARHALTGELSNQPFQMLPHQVIVTNRVVHSAPDKRAWLIADDVGLGKTIEAGMIMEVLRKKTLGRYRCLVITPAGLRTQWQEELALRFGRAFRVFDSRVPNDLESVDQLIASIDTLKLARFKDAVQGATPWDLVIVDEAHHLATTPNIQSYKLLHSMRTNGKARNLLFLTATPHSGNNEHFFNMLRILREDLFPSGAKEYPHVPLKQVMIRNRKSDVTDTERRRIFKGIAPAKIITFSPTADEVSFYEDLRDYLRNGYRVAEKLQREKDGQRASAVGFLMSTFAKLASSSRSAIESALENRLNALRGEANGGQDVDVGDARFPGEQATRAIGAQGIEVRAGKGKKKASLIDGELSQVESLLHKLRKLKTADTKLTSFIASIASLPKDVKLLIFTEYRATQNMLVEALQGKYGRDCVATINGSMDMFERRRQVDRFNEQQPNPRFMVSTEAGGEGLNMQKLCHTIVNYDLPWNPMVLQQRIGRVYRYGQDHPVVVLNLKVESASEAFADQRVYDYLERKIDDVTRKLQEVQEGDPEDLRDEVLGQVATQMSLDDLYRKAVEEGRLKAERKIDEATLQIQQILADPKGMLGLFKGLQRFDITDYEKVAAKVKPDHLDFFVKQYLGHEGCQIKMAQGGLLSFTVPKELVEVSKQIAKSDPYEIRDEVTESVVERITVDKAVAQKILGARLFRFGDAAFDAMVRHVQHGGFSNGVATLELPAAALGWQPGTQGTWVLFDLRVVRQEGSMGGARILRNELASYVTPRGGVPAVRDGVVEALHDAIDGPLQIDQGEARRAYQLALDQADARLAAMCEEVVREYGTSEAILPQGVQDVALAWVVSA